MLFRDNCRSNSIYYLLAHTAQGYISIEIMHTHTCVPIQCLTSPTPQGFLRISVGTVICFFLSSIVGMSARISWMVL